MARGARGLSWPALLRHARAWRLRDYDLAINFEPDIRSNYLLAVSGAKRRVGFISGGGGALLTDPVIPDPRAHIADNAKALVERAFGSFAPKPRRRRAARHSEHPRRCPAQGRRARCDARRMARRWSASSPRPDAKSRNGIPSGLRRSVPKLRAPATHRSCWSALLPTSPYWRLFEPHGRSTFRSSSCRSRPTWLCSRRSSNECPCSSPAIPDRCIWPLRLARPCWRFLGHPFRRATHRCRQRSRIVRIDIHCSPCNLMRQPPTRCLGHVPDCLAGIDSALVLRAANEMLDAS